jgi:hypothetical protein
MTGSAPVAKTIGIVEVALLDEIGRQSGQAIVTAFRPAILDRDVLSLDVVGVAKSLVEPRDIGRIRAGRADAKETDHRHRLLLSACGERPHGSRRKQGA